MGDQRIEINQEPAEQSITIQSEQAEQSISAGSEPSVLHGIDGVSPIATVAQTSTGATITITDRNGTTTAEITNGAQGEPGEPGRDGIDGQDGIDGKDGQNGRDGVDGTSATIAVGQVRTGSAGSSVVITNSGTNRDAILNFTIPRGDKGEAGQDGTNGSNGQDGFSPSASVSKSGNTATITITDRTGTTTASISDGESSESVLFVNILSIDEQQGDFTIDKTTDEIIVAYNEGKIPVLIENNPIDGDNNYTIIPLYTAYIGDETETYELLFIDNNDELSSSSLDLIKRNFQICKYGLGEFASYDNAYWEDEFADTNYHHTDNNFTSAYKTRLDTLTDSYIKSLIEDGTEVQY